MPLKSVLDHHDLLSGAAAEAAEARFLKWALCPTCEHVYYVQNGDLAHRDTRNRLLPSLKKERAAAAERQKEVKARKEDIKRRDITRTREILDCTAEIKALDKKLRDLAVRMSAVQDWCPKCLEDDFNFLEPYAPPSMLEGTAAG